MINALLPNVYTLYSLKTYDYDVFRRHKYNRLIMMTLIYTKQIIQLTGPADDTSLFARS